MPAKASRFVGTARDRQHVAKQSSRIDRVAATALAGDHGMLHRPGDRMDLCPRCNPEVDERLLRGLPSATPVSRTVQKTRLAARKAPAVKVAKAPKVKAPPGRRGRRSAIPGEPRNRILNVSVTVRELQAVYAAATTAGLSASSWARDRVLAAIRGTQ